MKRYIPILLLFATVTFGQHVPSSSVWWGGLTKEVQDSILKIRDSTWIDSCLHAVWSDSALWALWADSALWALFADSARVAGMAHMAIDDILRLNELYIGVRHIELVYGDTARLFDHPVYQVAQNSKSDSLHWWFVTYDSSAAYDSIFVYDKTLTNHTATYNNPFPRNDTLTGAFSIHYAHGYMWITAMRKPLTCHDLKNPFSYFYRMSVTDTSVTKFNTSWGAAQVVVDSPWIFVQATCEVWQSAQNMRKHRLIKLSWDGTQIDYYQSGGSTGGGYQGYIYIDTTGANIYFNSNRDGDFKFKIYNYNLNITLSSDWNFIGGPAADVIRGDVKMGCMYVPVNHGQSRIKWFTKTSLTEIDSVSTPYPISQVIWHKDTLWTLSGNHKTIDYYNYQLGDFYADWFMNGLHIENISDQAYLKVKTTKTDSVEEFSDGHGVWIDGAKVQDGRIDSSHYADTAGFAINIDSCYVCFTFRQMGINIINNNVDGGVLIPFNGTINSVSLYRRIAGTADSTIVDIHKNGTTIFTNQGKRPAIAYDDPDKKIIITDIDVTSVTSGDIFSCDIDGIETGFSEDIIVTIKTIK